jgi:Haemolymph juvenile hormone binding protein (JHBP)
MLKSKAPATFKSKNSGKKLNTIPKIKKKTHFFPNLKSANIKDLKLDGIVRLPKLDVFGKYKMTFTLLGAKSRSEGDYYTSFENAKIYGKFNAKIINKNGVEYLRFDPIGIKFDRGKVTNLKITNLFGGNRILGEIVTNLLLNNPDYLQDIYPQIESVLSKLFTNVANRIVENSSLDELLLQ